MDLRQSYDANQSYGTRVLNSLGTKALVAQVNVDDSTARPWVVTLAPVTTPGAQGGLTAVGLDPQPTKDSFALVEWGVGGGVSWALVDWGVGQQFSVYGSFVRVSAQINSWGTADGNAPTNPETRFSGFIVPGRSINVPVRTVDYGNVLPNILVNLDIPPFAKSFVVAVREVPPAAVNQLIVSGSYITGSVTQWQVRPTAFPNNNTQPDFHFTGTTYGIPAQSKKLSIFSVASGGSHNVQITYNLALS